MKPMTRSLSEADPAVAEAIRNEKRERPPARTKPSKVIDIRHA